MVWWICKCKHDWHQQIQFRFVEWKVKIESFNMTNECFKTNFDYLRTIGHFTSMITDRTTEVGCALSTFRTLSGTTRYNSYLFACNLASTNIIGYPVYKSGNKAEACINGTDSQFTGLCKTTESINPNILS